MSDKKASPSVHPDSVAQHVEIEPIATADLPQHLAENVSYGPRGVKGLVSSPVSHLLSVNLYRATRVESLRRVSDNINTGRLRLLFVLRLSQGFVNPLLTSSSKSISHNSYRLPFCPTRVILFHP